MEPVARNHSPLALHKVHQIKTHSPSPMPHRLSNTLPLYKAEVDLVLVQQYCILFETFRIAREATIRSLAV
jgi:hypothetical protein